jgi:hypothetical protein
MIKYGKFQVLFIKFLNFLYKYSINSQPQKQHSLRLKYQPFTNIHKKKSQTHNP